MRLSAIGDALTACRWTSVELPDTGTPTDPRESAIIDMAEIQISEYLEGKRKVFTVPLQIDASEFRK